MSQLIAKITHLPESETQRATVDNELDLYLTTFGPFIGVDI